MRLPSIGRRKSFGTKMMFAVSKLVFGGEPYDVVKMLKHRPELGESMNALSQAVLRGPSEWSVGQRELFAAFVSSVSQCPF